MAEVQGEETWQDTLSDTLPPPPPLGPPPDLPPLPPPPVGGEPQRRIPVIVQPQSAVGEPAAPIRARLPQPAVPAQGASAAHPWSLPAPPWEAHLHELNGVDLVEFALLPATVARTVPREHLHAYTELMATACDHGAKTACTQQPMADEASAAEKLPTADIRTPHLRGRLCPSWLVSKDFHSRNPYRPSPENK